MKSNKQFYKEDHSYLKKTHIALLTNTNIVLFLIFISIIGPTLVVKGEAGAAHGSSELEISARPNAAVQSIKINRPHRGNKSPLKDPPEEHNSRNLSYTPKEPSSKARSLLKLSIITQNNKERSPFDSYSLTYPTRWTPTQLVNYVNEIEEESKKGEVAALQKIEGDKHFKLSPNNFTSYFLNKNELKDYLRGSSFQLSIQRGCPRNDQNCGDDAYEMLPNDGVQLQVSCIVEMLEYSYMKKSNNFFGPIKDRFFILITSDVISFDGSTTRVPFNDRIVDTLNSKSCENGNQSQNEFSQLRMKFYCDTFAKDTTNALEASRTLIKAEKSTIPNQQEFSIDDRIKKLNILVNLKEPDLEISRYWGTHENDSHSEWMMVNHAKNFGHPIFYFKENYKHTENERIYSAIRDDSLGYALFTQGTSRPELNDYETLLLRKNYYENPYSIIKEILVWTKNVIASNRYWISLQRRTNPSGSTDISDKSPFLDL